LAYIDETYTPEVFAVACVVVSEHQVRALTSRLDRIVEVAASRHAGFDAQTELHAHELAMGKGAWRAYAPSVRARASVFRQAVDAVHDSSEVIMAHCRRPGPRRGSASPETLHAAGLTAILDRLDRYASSAGERCIVIVDDVSYRDELRIAARRVRHDSFVDVIHFAKSRTSRPLQGADLAAYVVRRRPTIAEPPTRSRSLNQWLWEAIASKVDLVDEGP
jgi:uncharacterized protein (DUF3084 family)